MSTAALRPINFDKQAPETLDQAGRVLEDAAEYLSALLMWEAYGNQVQSINTSGFTQRLLTCPQNDPIQPKYQYKGRALQMKRTANSPTSSTNNLSASSNKQHTNEPRRLHHRGSGRDLRDLRATDRLQGEYLQIIKAGITKLTRVQKLSEATSLNYCNNTGSHDYF
ncbi:hypothetical protein DM02DRAFT_652388 [Periconia macrospinosa]|uniref:Uncharacterized protein n=1 Tax=Periconia macrospinosa TaxID=97972 RepID=A0A2V1E346_9PLEO|nr:hypothetical protein DM02DRAFT_652388 [Periconia macrospinosa]